MDQPAPDEPRERAMPAGDEAQDERTDELLTYADLCTRLKLKKGTAFWWVARRTIPHVRLGPRSVRFRTSEVERWLADRAVPALADGGSARAARAAARRRGLPGSALGPHDRHRQQEADHD